MLFPHAETWGRVKVGKKRTTNCTINVERFACYVLRWSRWTKKNHELRAIANVVSWDGNVGRGKNVLNVLRWLVAVDSNNKKKTGHLGLPCGAEAG
jgi:hypothetical protein